MAAIAPIPEEEFDMLTDWVEKNLFSLSVYDKISNRTIAQSMAEKAAIELGDAVSSEDIIDAIGIVNWRKNHDLERYVFE